MRYTQKQKGKYDDREDIENYKLMTLALNMYEDLYTKDKWMAKPPEEKSSKYHIGRISCGALLFKIIL